MVFVTCSNISVNDTKYVDVITGVTTATAARQSYTFSVGSSVGCVFSGLDFYGISDVHPYLGIMEITVGCSNVKLRNIGSRASPLSLGSANQGAYLIAMVAGAAAKDVKVQRCYVSNTRTSIWTGDNSCTQVTFENVAGDYADVTAAPILNCQAKAVGCTHSLTAQTSCYGTHFLDMFTSATVGRILLMCNEKTSVEPSASTYSVLSGNPAFTSAGGLYMPTIGDSIEFTMPYFALGHTSFQNAAAVMGGGTIGNYTLQYQLDRHDGSGFGALKALTGANLSGETVIDPALGVKLKIRITTAVANTAAIISLYVLTNSTALAQDYLYPLDLTSLTLTGLKNPTEVRVFDAGTTDEVAGQENVTSGAFSASVDAGSYPSVDISILALGYQNTRLIGVDLSGGDVSIPVQQIIDRQYENA